MSNKREAEDELNKTVKRMKPHVEEYVSKIDGSIDMIVANKKLICFLYEEKSDLLIISDINGELSDVTVVHKHYCLVAYRQYMRNNRISTTKERVVLDTTNQKVFTIDPKKWDNQADVSKQWAFSTNPLVIKYVKDVNPADLIISTISENEKMMTFTQGDCVICVKTEKNSSIHQLC